MDSGGTGNLADANSLSTASDKPRVDDLTTAAARGDFPEVTRLIQAGVGVNEVNIYGRTALQVTKSSRFEIFEILLRNGADPNARDRSYPGHQDTLVTPAHDVARAGYLDVLKCLLRFGADVNIRDSWGNTPAHLAAKYGHYDVVMYLSHATDLRKAVNMHGLTPLDYRTGSEEKDSGQCEWMQEMKVNPLRLDDLATIRVRATMTGRLRQCRRLPIADKLKAQLLLQFGDD